MTVSCGNCHEKHESVEDVRACYKREPYERPVAPSPVPQPVVPEWAKHPATEKQLDYLRALLDEKDWGGAEMHGLVVETCMNVCDGKTIGKKEASDAIEALRALPRKMLGGDPSVQYESVPEGRYALIEEDGSVSFYKVDRPTEGKWTGRIFVKLIVGGVGHWQEFRRKTADILPRIEKMGAVESATLFGIKVRHCGRCMSPLSKLQSRAAGYGSHCAEKLGWPYPSEDEARRILQERGEEPSDEEMEAEVRAEYEMERRHEQWLDNGGPHAEAIARDAELDRMHEDPAMSMSSQYTGEEPWWDHGNQS